MKNLVKISVIALVLFSNISNAKSTETTSVNLLTKSVFSNDSIVEKLEKESKLKKHSFLEENEVFNPESVIAFIPKTMNEIITEGDNITDYNILEDTELKIYEESIERNISQLELIIESKVSNEVFSLYCEKSIEDEIAEQELIIESKETNEVRPLDFRFNSQKWLVKML